MLAHMIRAADAGGIPPLVRVHTRDPDILLKVLEMGAEGINLPCVKDAGGARRARRDPLRAARLPQRLRPHARRALQLPALGFSRAREAPAGAVTLWCALGDPESLARVGEIAALEPGPDVDQGARRLSAALGFHGQVNHPEVIAAAERDRASRAALPGEDLFLHHDRAHRRHRAVARAWLSAFTYAADAILLMGGGADVVEKVQGAANGPRR